MELVDFKWDIKLKLLLVSLVENLVKLRAKPTSILILGMHRSGTSCLTGLLRDRGLYLGDVDRSNPFNQKGNQESFLVNQYNEELLNINHGSWYEPQKIKRVPLKLKYNIEKYYLKSMLSIAQQDCSMWVLKDPRLLFCLPFWKRERAIFIGTFRHPKKVASSLYTRSQKRQDNTSHFALEDWEDLWFKYNLELIDLYDRESFPLVNFDWEKERYLNAVDNIFVNLGLSDLPQDSGFFDSKLIHQNEDRAITNPQHQELYDRLVAIAEIEEKKNQNIEVISQKSLVV